MPTALAPELDGRLNTPTTGSNLPAANTQHVTSYQVSTTRGNQSLYHVMYTRVPINTLLSFYALFYYFMAFCAICLRIENKKQRYSADCCMAAVMYNEFQVWYWCQSYTCCYVCMVQLSTCRCSDYKLRAYIARS